jgi:hypothetical protein
MIAAMASEIGVAGCPAYMSRRGKKLTIVAHNRVLAYAATLTPAKRRLIHSHHAVPPPPAPVRYTCVQDPREASLGVFAFVCREDANHDRSQMSVDPRRAMPKRKTLAQQIAALKPGRQTIEAERDELRRIKDGAGTATEACKRAGQNPRTPR